MIRLLFNLRYLGVWLFNMFQNEFNQDWDDQLNEYLDHIEKGVDASACDHTLDFTIGSEKIEVWISNYPYSYGWLRLKSNNHTPDIIKYRPSMATMDRLKHIVNKQKELQKQVEHKKWYS